MTGNLKLLINFIEKFLGTVKFGNDQIAPILGFGDLVQGAVTIKRVYYLKGLSHNLFSVGQFCDADLETMALNHDSLSPENQRQVNVPQADRTVTTSNELDLLFTLMFDELLNGSSKVVSKSSATKDHPLEQVIGNPSQSVRTRRQLESDAKMCMFALTVSRTEPRNIKEAMEDSAWIESMQEELYQFDRLDVWELVDRPLCTNVINLKWLWKNKRDEENTVIRHKSCLVAKGYA
nr:Gag-Pol polyprotein [Tanacetum cinerariifolium]